MYAALLLLNGATREQQEGCIFRIIQSLMYVKQGGFVVCVRTQFFDLHQK